MIPYGRQSINESDIEAVVEVLRSDWLTQGPIGPAFERRVAQFCGASHAVAVCNATAALHLACLAVGIGPGDIVWTSPISFVASANCALYCGAEIDFVDIDPLTANMSAEALAVKLREATLTGRLPKAVIPVDFAGHPCNLSAIRRLADEFGFKIIEDASHALGAYYQDQPIGCGRLADISVFSFHPVKMITTGEGGMALTNSCELANRLRLLRSHGITRDSTEMLGKPHGPWYYQQIALGYNFRLPDIQAALGISQMSRLEEFVEARRKLFAEYVSNLEGLPLSVPKELDDAKSSWHLFVIRTERPEMRPILYGELRAAGIGVNVHYIPIHLQPFYRRFGFQEGDFPHAEEYYSKAISLPLYPGLTETDQRHVISSVQSAFSCSVKSISEQH